LAVAVWLLAAGAAAAPPQWLATGALSEYGPDKYLVGVGSGSRPEDAAAAARRGIASQIQSTITARVSFVTREVSRAGQDELTQFVTSSIDESVTRTLTGAEVVRQETDRDTHYALAVLDRGRLVRQLQAELEELDAAASGALAGVEAQLAAGDLIAALDRLGLAQAHLTGLASRRVVHDALAPAPYVGSQEHSLANVDARIRALLGQVRVAVVSGDGQVAAPAAELSQPIIVALARQSGDASTPLARVAVTARYEDGVPLERLLTDDQGRVRIVAQARVPARGDRGWIRARPVLDGLPTPYQGYVRRLEVPVSYRIRRTDPQRFAVVVCDAGGTRLPVVERRIEQSLASLGHSVDPGAAAVLQGTVRESGQRTIATMGTPMVLQQLELDLALRSTAGNRLLGTARFAGQGTARDAVAARASALQAIRVEPSAVAELLRSTR
jgi:hypothetical protein